MATSGGVIDWRHSIVANGKTVALLSRTNTGVNTIRYVLEDRQGSIAKITDSSGNNTVGESFTAFGARRHPATWSGAPSGSDLTTINSISRQGYTGHTALGNMGLNHMNGRVQDAITGRFLSADPYITQPGNTQGYNRYSYVNNNPVTFIDPTGFDACSGGPNEGGSAFYCDAGPYLYDGFRDVFAFGLGSLRKGIKGLVGGGGGGGPPPPPAAEPTPGEGGLAFDVRCGASCEEGYRPPNRLAGRVGNFAAGGILAGGTPRALPGPAGALAALAIVAVNQISDLSNDQSESESKRQRVAFGQRRISNNFSDNLTLLGSSIMIEIGISRPMVDVTSYKGQLVALNNRTLAAYGLAGIQPNLGRMLVFDTLPEDVRDRFLESGVPSFTIPVTTKRDFGLDDILFYVTAP